MKKQLFVAAVVAVFVLPLRVHAEITVSAFYDALDPYGDWIEVGDYGYCWHPRDVSAEWRPYTDGEWVYTDAGWTWVSEEPYGWATYHYGRWARLARHGWVWVPDTQWAPAWVSWRHSDRYVGWAPLPPESRVTVGVSLGGWVDAYFDVGPTNYAFVETRQFGAPRLANVILPPRQNVTIINETRNVTNINVVNNVVVNNGPDYDAIARQAERPIRKLRLEREEVASATAVAKTRIEGDAVKIAAPRLAAQPGAKPRKIAQRVERADVNTGWQDAGSAAAVKSAREKVKAEAKIPENLPPKAVAKERLRAGAPEEATPKAETIVPKAETAAPGAETTPPAEPGKNPKTKSAKGAKSAEKKETEPSPAPPLPKREEKKSEPLRFREPQSDQPEPLQTPPTAQPKERTTEPAKSKEDSPQAGKRNQKVKGQKLEAPQTPPAPEVQQPNAERAKSKNELPRAEKKIEKSKPAKFEAPQPEAAAQPKMKANVPQAENQFQKAGKQKSSIENRAAAMPQAPREKKSEARPVAPQVKPPTPAAHPGQPVPNVQAGKKQKGEKGEGKKKKGENEPQ